MNSLTLLLWITGGIVLQLAIYLGIAFWRHWQDYRALRGQADELNLPAVPESSPSVSPPGWSGWRAFRVERKVMEDVAESVCSFDLVAEDGKSLPGFQPGQFLTFHLDVGAGEPITRCYSLSDAPRADHYRVSIKRVPAPVGSAFPPGISSNHFHDRVEVGSVLQVRAPSGHFYLQRGNVPVVLIGGGIGITPMLSMLNWVLVEQPEREVWLFYGVRNGHELVMREHLEALAARHTNFHLRLCFSDPQESDLTGSEHALHGRVAVGLLRQQLPLKPYHYYICGPSPMMESLVPALEDWGVPAAHIHFEAFGPASIKRRKSLETRAAEASDIVVSFARSGKQLAWSPAAGSLLEFAEDNGIKVDSGCRAGGCGACQTTIRSGEVAYRQAPDFDPEPGSCLLCVCMPHTSVTLEA